MLRGEEEQEEAEDEEEEEEEEMWGVLVECVSVAMNQTSSLQHATTPKLHS